MNPALVPVAHADAWEELGRCSARLGLGGGSDRLPGIRVMATGLAHPKWNSADVVDPAVVDVAAVAAWYGERGLAWGVRVPDGAAWPHGRRLLRLRLMSVDLGAARPGPVVGGLVVRAARGEDAPAVLHVDATAFGEDPDDQRPWIDLLVAAATFGSVTVAVAELDGDVVASGYSVRTDGDAGPAVYVAGIAVLPEARRRGVGGAVSAWLVARGRQTGAEHAHLHPDTDLAARVYQRLGFVEVPGLDVYVDHAP